MARPRAIEEGAKRSRELIEQIQKDQQEAEQKTQAAVSQHLGELGGDSKPTDGQGQTDLKAGQDPDPQTAGQASTPPEPPSDPGQKKPASAPKPDDTLQDRIRELENENARLAQANTVLRGKYENEVPRLANEIRELKDQLKQQNQPPAGDTGQPAANTDAVEKIKESLRAEYPEDVVNNLDQLIRETVRTSLPAQRESVVDANEVKKLQQQVQQTMGQLREQRLTALVPDWKEIQQREYAAWVKFLQYRDPISGRERNDFLQEAWNSHDVDRVAEVFNLYKRERDASKPPPRDREPPPTVPDDQGARNTPDPAEPGRKTYTRSYIAQVEAMARRGEFKGRETELNRLRQEFRKAAAEGRVDVNG